MKSFKISLLFILSTWHLLGQEADNVRVHSEATIYFDSEESVLTADDLPKLLRLIAITDSLDTFTFLVDAHTDEVGDAAYNLALSQKRKASVVSFLEQHNIPSASIGSNYYGETQRVAQAEDETSRQLNRRVVVQLLTKQRKEINQLYLKGTIASEATKKGIPAQIQLRSKDFESTATTDSLGRFKILSPSNAPVDIEVVAKDHFIASKTLKITEAHRDINLKIPLSKIEAGKKFSLKNMLFVGNKSIMLPTSFKSLEHLKRFMTTNQEQCIEIAGHVNVPNLPKLKVGDYDHQLSIARALEVHDALVDIGIDTSRLLARGYGNWQMIFPKAKREEQMKYNRRVEIVISDCNSTATIPNDSITNRAHFRDMDSRRREY